MTGNACSLSVQETLLQAMPIVDHFWERCYKERQRERLITTGNLVTGNQGLITTGNVVVGNEGSWSLLGTLLQAMH